MKAAIISLIFWSLTLLVCLLIIAEHFYPPLWTSLPCLDEQKPSLEVVAR